MNKISNSALAIKDKINPDHYKSEKLECWQAIKAALGPAGFVAYCQGNIMKYNWRLGKKDLASQDSSKAQWYQQKVTETMKEIEDGM